MAMDLFILLICKTTEGEQIPLHEPIMHSVIKFIDLCTHNSIPNGQIVGSAVGNNIFVGGLSLFKKVKVIVYSRQMLN